MAIMSKCPKCKIANAVITWPLRRMLVRVDFTIFMGPLCLINELISIGAHFAEAYKNDLKRPVPSINLGTGVILRGEMASKCVNLTLWLISHPGHVPLAE